MLVGHLRNVQRHYASLFEHALPSDERRALAFPPDADDRETLDRLVEMGFRQPLEVSATVRRWLAGGYRSLKGEAARDQLAELVPLLLDQLARSENPEAACLRVRPLSVPVCTAAADCCRCCGKIRIWSRSSRSCSAPRRGSPTFWPAIRR